jgi:Tfp pilus assembly protein PilO
MTKMRQWSIFTAVAVLLVLAAGWFLLVKPQRTHAATLRASSVSQQQANEQLQSQITALEGEQRNLPHEQAQLQKFATQVPNNSAEPTVIRQLSAAASGSDVDMVTLTPGTAAAVTAAAAPAAAPSAGATPGATELTPATTTASSLVELPISLGITGTYANVESFFQSLEKLPRAMLITGWTLCPEATADGGGAGASCTGPTAPANKTLPDGSVGGTLTADVFYAPPAGTAAPTTLGATGTTDTTGTTATTPTTSTTPSTAPTAAAS